MASKNYLDETGLQTLWNKIKTLFLTKEDAKSIANYLNILKENVGLESGLNLPDEFSYNTIVEAINTIDDKVNTNTTTISNTNNSKQDKLTAGENISITNNIIASDTNKWSFGTAITGKSTTETVFNTGLAKSIVGDVYLNTNNGNAYQCTTAGNASTAKWVYRYTFGAILG